MSRGEKITLGVATVLILTAIGLQYVMRPQPLPDSIRPPDEENAWFWLVENSELPAAEYFRAYPLDGTFSNVYLPWEDIEDRSQHDRAFHYANSYVSTEIVELLEEHRIEEALDLLERVTALATLKTNATDSVSRPLGAGAIRRVYGAIEEAWDEGLEPGDAESLIRDLAARAASDMEPVTLEELQTINRAYLMEEEVFGWRYVWDPFYRSRIDGLANSGYGLKVRIINETCEQLERFGAGGRFNE